MSAERDVIETRQCVETSGHRKHRCSRDEGHDGPHIADLGNLVCAWPNETETR